MIESEITALAREYAEEKGRVMEQKQSLPNCLIKEVMEMDATELTRFLQWLSRRYCLVEKSVIKKTWSEIANVYLAHQHITYDGARYLFNEVLFPDLGKEVEG